MVFVWLRGINWCTLFAVTSVTTCGKKYFSVYIKQPTSWSPLVIGLISDILGNSAVGKT